MQMIAYPTTIYKFRILSNRIAKLTVHSFAIGYGKHDMIWQMFMCDGM